MEVLVIVVAAALIGAWLGALRAQLRRHRARSAEWADAHQRPELWTSAARCTSCDARGGVLDEQDGMLWFVCLRCGQQSRRRSRG